MRRIPSVVVGVALACGLVVAAPAGTALSETTMSFQMPADEGPAPPSGSRVYVSGNLRSGGEPVAGAQVYLFSRAYGHKSFRLVAAGTTGRNGTITVRPVLYRTSELRWSFKGNATHARSVSALYVRTIGSKVGARPHDATISRSQVLEVYGRSWPSKAGYRVTLWRGQVPCFCPALDQPTARVAVATIKADGSFRLTARFSRPDHFQMFVRVNAGGGTTVGYSPYFNVQVR